MWNCEHWSRTPFSDKISQKEENRKYAANAFLVHSKRVYRVCFVPNFSFAAPFWQINAFVVDLRLLEHTDPQKPPSCIACGHMHVACVWVEHTKSESAHCTMSECCRKFAMWQSLFWTFSSILDACRLRWTRSCAYPTARLIQMSLLWKVRDPDERSENWGSQLADTMQQNSAKICSHKYSSSNV